MNLEGERRLPAAIDQAWAALNDPAVLKACITGCESLDLTGEDEYTAVMAVRIGPVNAKFKGRLRLLNVQPPNSYTIEFDGQGGVAGFGKLQQPLEGVAALRGGLALAQHHALHVVIDVERAGHKQFSLRIKHLANCLLAKADLSPVFEHGDKDTYHVADAG